MSGTCTIPVTEEYVLSLVNLSKTCHAELTDSYFRKIITGVQKDIDEEFERVSTLYDVIYYLEQWTDEDFPCEAVHAAKERIMSFCNFTEQDIEDGALALSPPDPVTDLSASTSSDTDEAIELSWTYSAGPVDGFSILRSTTPGGPYLTVGSTGLTSFTDSGLTPGTTYYYVVVVVDGQSQSSNSNEASALPSNFFVATFDTLGTNVVTLPMAAGPTVDWGDGVIDNLNTHVYAVNQEYTIKIDGPSGWAFNLGGDRLKISDIQKWAGFLIEDRAFYGCENLNVSATDAPVMSANCELIFSLCRSLTGNAAFDAWDTSPVTSFNNAFSFTDVFNTSLNSWDVSNVEDFQLMFRESGFNGDITGWDTSSGRFFSFMFEDNTVFDQPIGNWNMSSAESLTSMFEGAVFNQPINNWERVGSTLANVTTMSQMFQNNNVFNQPIGGWNVSGCISFQGMFDVASSFNQDLNGWDTSSAQDMGQMFQFAFDFNGQIDNFNVTNVTDMAQMFRGASSFNRSLSNWERAGSTLANVVDMLGMFAGTPLFNQDISNWNTSSVTTMLSMFENADDFDQDLGSWNISSLTTAFRMFTSANSMSSLNTDAIIIGWNAQIPLVQNNVPFDTVGNRTVGIQAIEQAPYNWTIT